MRSSLPIVCIGLLLCGCRAPAVEDEVPTPESGLSSEIDHLRALGYVDYAPDEGGIGPSGVTVHDRERSRPGYNLYPIRALGRAELVDADGQRVHAWSMPGEKAWRRCTLLDNGDVLVIGGIAPNTYVLRLGRDGEEIWRVPLAAHHDVGVAPDGRIVALTKTARAIPAVHPTVPVRDDAVTLFDPRDPTPESLSLYDVLAASPEVFTFQDVAETDGSIDLIHANSVRFLTDVELSRKSPIYRVGNLVLCMRQQDTVALVDPETGRAVWAWGQGILEAPHDATVLDDGHVLVFDNGSRRGWSRVLEVDPLTDTIVWEYRADPTDAFFTHARGSAQRLANGNTLISESNRGRGFEVTPDGEVVWEYYQPHLDRMGRRAVTIRFYRYDTAAVEAWLREGAS